MAASGHVVSSVTNIQNFSEQIQRLPISDDIRVELSECLQRITGIDEDSVQEGSGDRSTSRFNSVILLLNKFAKATIDALEACELLPFPAGIICKAVTEVIGFIFSKDVASVVIKRFTAILEADLIAKCRATCTKTTHCISYIQGLPEADGLQQDQKNLHLQLVSSDVPIHTGLDEVLFLGEKIKDRVNAADLNQTDKLFEQIRLYCCLTTFRELFLLFRFAVQSLYSVDATPIRNVIEAQKKNDEVVLKFLYKPSTKTVRLFRCCYLDQWPILQYFLQRRGLDPENLSGMSGRKFKIISVSNRSKPLRPYIFPLLKEDFLALHGDYYDNATHIELRDCSNNVFTLWSHCYTPSRQVYCDKLLHMSVCEGVPSPQSSRWYILKLQPGTPEEIPCYMIWLESDYKECVYAYWNNNVGLSCSSKPGARYFLNLEDIS